MKYLFQAAALLAAFLLGWLVGHDGRSPPVAERTDGDRAPALSGAAVPEVPVAVIGAGPGAQDPAALRQAFFETLLQEARAGRARQAQAQLQEYLTIEPLDAEALLLAADLQQMSGQGLAAIDQLLALLPLAADAEVIARARQRLALLAGVHESQLANRGDVAGLIRFYEHLAERDPGYDGHRLDLVRWLLRAGRTSEAERVLLQTGTAGVDPQARADLEAEVRLARTGLPLERTGEALHVRASRHGEPLRLLLDTGATTTVFGRDRARALAATPTGDRVRVRTAGGVVEAELHLVRDLQVGALHLATLPVLVLDHPLPDGVDGLLGMDVIGRFGGAGRAFLQPHGGGG